METVSQVSQADSEVGLDEGAWPSVTVVVPTRDRPELLRRTLQAILSQRYMGRIECLTVFDQSEPSVRSETVNERRSIKSVENQRTPGLAGARNSGALQAQGELLAFCDDDDVWLPDKLRLQVEALRHTQALVSTCGIYVSYGDRTIARLPAHETVTLAHLLRSRTFESHPSTIVARRQDYIERIGLVDEAIPGSYAEDYEWLLRAARVAPVVAVRKPLVTVYWHQSSWFENRWETMVSALAYLLDKYPEFKEEPKGLARIYGRIAFAYAASRHGSLARRWALKSLGLNWRERRAYLALAVSLGLLRAPAVLRLAHRAGRGI